jgi:hypothetical protein
MPKLSRSKSGFAAISPPAPQAVRAVAIGAEQPELAEPMHVVPARAEMALSIPSNERFLQLRAEAKQNGKLKDLQKLVAAWLAVGEKCNLVFEEMTRLAIYRLEVERDLGAHLAQTVHRGGDRPNSPRRSLLREGGLPDDITWNQSAAYQKLAAIPEDVFRAYLEAAHAKHAVPSSAGARVFAAPPKRSLASQTRQVGRRTSSTRPGALPQAVVECVERIMTPDVVVGDAALRAKQRVSIDAKDAIERLRGEVFIAQCTDPERWLVAIDQARREARVTRAVIALPATTWAEWFRHLEHGEWLICFLRDVRDEAGNGIVMAHIGERPSVFRLAFRSLGVVLRAATAE